MKERKKMELGWGFTRKTVFWNAQFFWQLGRDKTLRYYQDHQYSILEWPVTSSGIRNFLHSARPVSSHFHEAASAAVSLCILGWRLPEKGFMWFCAVQTWCSCLVLLYETHSPVKKGKIWIGLIKSGYWGQNKSMLS